MRWKLSILSNHRYFENGSYETINKSRGSLKRQITNVKRRKERMIDEQFTILGWKVYF